MQDCIFCKIANKEVPVEEVYENNKIIAFKDINPEAPVHLVLIPKKHIPTFFDLKGEDAGLIGDLHLAAVEIARKMGLEKGFRLVSNCNEDAGQLVFHIHYHMMAGRMLNWPPG